jgi:hypothetical protein
MYLYFALGLLFLLIVFYLNKDHLASLHTIEIIIAFVSVVSLWPIGLGFVIFNEKDLNGQR